MAVETYLEEELAGLVTDVEQNDEWKRLIGELDLTGQATMLPKKDKSPIPFPMMNQKMQRVYQTLCPHRENVQAFDGGTIPLRVLSLVALCRQEGYFKRLEVWSNTEKPDPILVGHTGNNDWSNDKLYIIARWGDELRAFVELEKIAYEWKMQEWSRVVSERAQLLASDVRKWFDGDVIYLSM